jgi:hypothetical protein
MDSRLEKLRQALESAVQGMSSEQLRWRPEGKWCAGEVLEHLYLTYTGSIRGFERVLEAGKPLARSSTMKDRVRTLLVVGLGHIPEGRKAPANTVPKGLAVEELRGDIGEKIAVMDAAIARCEERFGRGVKLLDHPLLGPLTGTQWRKFHVVHGMHHRKQLLRLRAGTE